VEFIPVALGDVSGTLRQFGFETGPYGLFIPLVLGHATAEKRKGELDQMKKAALYVRVSTADQHVESQLYDLRELAAQRGMEIVKEYEDRGVSGTKARSPGLDALMQGARQRKFSVVLVAAFDRVARSTKHFLQLIDELDSLGVVFLSRRENIDTSGPMGRLFLTLISSIAELESDLIRERVRAGMRRARLEGRQIGRARLDVNREQVVIDRRSGMSLTTVAKRHNISRASVCRLMKESRVATCRCHSVWCRYRWTQC
jgi:DNA invertase Pin-like site-specific DNA recombinase